MMDAGLGEFAYGEDRRMQVDGHQPAEQGPSRMPLYQQTCSRAVERSYAAGVRWNGGTQSGLQSGCAAEHPILVRRNAHDEVIGCAGGTNGRVRQWRTQDRQYRCGDALRATRVNPEMQEAGCGNLSKLQSP